MNKKTKIEDLGRIDVDAFHNAKKIPLRLVLDDLRSLNNIGSIFRTADAFRVEEILLCGICATPPHRDIRKTALGATESVSWQYFDDVLDALIYCKKDNYKIISIEQTEKAISLEKYNPIPNEKFALVLGNEVKGVSQAAIDQSDLCIEVPQFGTKHSFNVSVTCGIILWDFVSKMEVLDRL